MIQTTKIIDVLKSLLRAKKISYKKLAEELNLSEANIKRIFSEKKFSLDRLEKICDLLELSFFELAHLANTVEETKITKLSSFQEQVLAENEKLLMFFYLILRKSTLKDIVTNYTFTLAESRKYLKDLEELGLLYRMDHDQFQLKVSSKVRWRSDGPFFTLFKKGILNEYFDTHFKNSKEKFIFIPGQLSEKNIKLIIKKFDQLSFEIRDMINIDTQLSKEDLTPVGILLAHKPWVYKGFREIRRE